MDQAKKIASMLKEKYGAKRVILFGPIVTVHDLMALTFRIFWRQRLFTRKRSLLVPPHLCPLSIKRVKKSLPAILSEIENP